MTLKSKLSFFKEYITQENYRKEKLNEQFFYYIGLLSIQLGFIGYYLLNLPTLQNGTLWNIFLFISTIVGTIYLYLVYNIIRFLESKHGQYKYLPYPTDVNRYINIVESSTMSEVDQDEEFDEFLLESYVEISEHNTKSNEVKQSIIIRMRQSLLGNTALLCVLFIPYFILMGNELNSHKIIVLNDNIKIDTNISKVKLVNEKIIIDNANKIKKAEIILPSNNNSLFHLQQNKVTIPKIDLKGKSMSENNNQQQTNDNQNQTDTNSSNTNKQEFERPKVRLVQESFDPTSDSVKQKGEEKESK